jgi:hypothetical protein
MLGTLKIYFLHSLLVPFTFLSCTSSHVMQDNERRSGIVLLDSYYERNTPGLLGVPTSTEYFFKVRLNTVEKVLFDSIWIAGRCLPVFVSPLSGPIYSTPITYKKNDMILVRASTLSSEGTTPPPIEYKGEALIKYSVAGQPKFLIVRELVFQKTTPMH